MAMSKRTVIIVGKTGHGKSSLANGIFGLTGEDRKFQESEPGVSVMRCSVIPQVHLDTVEDVFLEVIDTPGLFEQVLSIERRWPDILKAFRIASQPIDAIIIVVSSKELHSGARCVKEIMDNIGTTIFSRTIICFSRYLAPFNGSEQTKEEILKGFNECLGLCGCSVVGARWVFYDKDDPAREESVREILDHVEKIQDMKPTKITRALFKKYTLVYFKSVIRSIPREFTLAQLQNESFIDMTLMREFLDEKEMNKILREPNDAQSVCSIM